MAGRVRSKAEVQGQYLLDSESRRALAASHTGSSLPPGRLVAWGGHGLCKQIDISGGMAGV